MELKFVEAIKLATELPNYSMLQKSKTIRDDEDTTLLLAQGIGCFHDRKFNESAQWFLRTWEQFSEYLLEVQYVRFRPAPNDWYQNQLCHDTVTLRSYQEICIYSLHDAAIAYFLSSEEFKVNKDIIRSHSKWPKSAERIKGDNGKVDIGTSIKDLVSIVGPVEEILSNADTAKDAANAIAHICRLYIISAGYSRISQGREIIDMVESNLTWIIALTTYNGEQAGKAIVKTLQGAWESSHKDENQRSKWIKHSYDIAKANLEESS